jgi:uncharacterized protein with von Willebrand factor type A (vWA) domain
MSEQEYLEFSGAKDGKVVDNKGKVLMMCLDRSGSMAGRPFEAVKLGATKIGEAIWDANVNPFERVITLLYDTSVEHTENKDLDSYKRYISGLKTRGSTDFKKVFEHIYDYVVDPKNLIKELTVIFFTDGQDTCNNKDKVD